LVVAVGVALAGAGASTGRGLSGAARLASAHADRPGRHERETGCARDARASTMNARRQGAAAETARGRVRERRTRRIVGSTSAWGREANAVFGLAERAPPAATRKREQLASGDRRTHFHGAPDRSRDAWPRLVCPPREKPGHWARTVHEPSAKNARSWPAARRRSGLHRRRVGTRRGAARRLGAAAGQEIAFAGDGLMNGPG
jgi:hypothetical protein